MLEHIIKQFLFEQRRYTAVVKAAPATSAIKSAEAGAVYAFFVRFRFKPGSGVIPTETQLYKELATIISENSEVGKSSKYANGKYVYIVSNRLKESDNRLLFNVWIYTVEMYHSMFSNGADLDSDTIIIQSYSNYHIGKSRLIPNQSVSKYTANLTPEAEKLQKLVKTINTTPVSQETPDLGSNVKMSPVDIVTPEKEVPGDEEEVLGVDDAIKKTTEDNIKYPYMTKEGKIIYTTGPTDDWVYTYANNIWYGMKKPEFEQYQTAGGVVPKFLEIKNKTAIGTLNKLANITPITAKEKIDIKPAEKIVKPDETKFTPGPAIFKDRVGTRIILFNWDTKSKKWKNVGTYRIEKKSPGETIVQSKDKTMTLIQFPTGKYWVLSKLIK